MSNELVVQGKKYELIDGKYKMIYENKNAKPAPVIYGHTYPALQETDSTFDTNFNGRTVYALEKLRGHQIRFIYQDGKAYIGSKDKILNAKDNYYNALEVYKEKYAKPFTTLVNLLYRVPFTLYGEIISTDSQNGIKYVQGEEVHFVFYDLYLNSNWMMWDDFAILLSKAGLDTVPMVYMGDYNRSNLNALANIKSQYSKMEMGQELEGIVVRPLVEDNCGKSNYNRLISKITNKKYRPKKTSITIESKKNKSILKKNRKAHPSKIANELIKILADDKNVTFNHYLMYLSDEGTHPSLYTNDRNEQNEAIKHLTTEVIKSLEDDIAIESVANNVDMLEIKAAMREQLPKKIRKAIF